MDVLESLWPQVYFYGVAGGAGAMLGLLRMMRREFRYTGSGPARHV